MVNYAPGQNAFLISAKNGKIEQMEYLLNIDPDILKSVDSHKLNALHLCAQLGTLEGSKFLVEKNDFDIFDRSTVSEN